MKVRDLYPETLPLNREFDLVRAGQVKRVLA